MPSARHLAIFAAVMIALAFTFIVKFTPQPKREAPVLRDAHMRVAETIPPVSLQPPPEKKELPPRTSPPPLAARKQLTETIAPKPAAPLAPLPPPPPPLPPPPRLSDQEIYARFSPAVVQIYCATPEQLFSASGVIVNAEGLILTNAHVAAIVEKNGVSTCQARHGNPADTFAGIKIVFPGDTTLKIKETNVPQQDFAFLKLVEPKDLFTVAEIDAHSVPVGEALLTLGYPSEFLESLNTSRNSNLVFSLLRVDSYADLDDNRDTAEGYVFHGGLVLQQGSSGTALFTRAGKVVGMMFATTKGKTTAERDGLALTALYIDKILREKTGQGLNEFISSH